MNTDVVIRSWQIVQCQRCKHIWDELDPDDEVCGCIDKHGSRTVTLVTAGTSATPRYFRLDTT